MKRVLYLLSIAGLLGACAHDGSSEAMMYGEIKGGVETVHTH